MKHRFLFFCATFGAALLMSAGVVCRAQEVSSAGPNGITEQNAQAMIQQQQNKILAMQENERQTLLKNAYGQNSPLSPGKPFAPGQAFAPGQCPPQGFVPPYSNTYIYLGPDSGGYVVTGLPSYTYLGVNGGGQYSTIAFPFSYAGLPVTYTCLPTSVFLGGASPQLTFVGGPIPATEIIQSGEEQQPQTVYNIYNYTTNNYYDSASAQSGKQDQSAAGSDSGAASQSGAESIPDSDQLAAVFQDISRSWMRSDISLLRKHCTDDCRISVSIDGKYQYSLVSSAFLSAADQAFDCISTRSFEFDSFRKCANGDIVAYAAQTYYLRSGNASDALKSAKIAYTFGKRGGAWVIVGIDTAKKSGQTVIS